jgi:hypothetical protein
MYVQCVDIFETLLTWCLITITHSLYYSINYVEVICNDQKAFWAIYYTPAPRRGRGGYTVLPLSFLPSIVAEKNATKNGHIQNVCSMCIKINKVDKQEVGIWWVQKRFPRYGLIFRRIFLSNYWWQKSDIWSQASYRYPISWEAFLNPSDSYEHICSMCIKTN